MKKLLNASNYIGLEKTSLRPFIRKESDYFKYRVNSSSMSFDTGQKPNVGGLAEKDTRFLMI